ncbi:MAG: PqqD family protein [Syntrophobacterales bacterium]|nr:PqqD family protein [Syntrophobacterales bacterium]
MKRARRNFLAIAGGVAVMLPITKSPTPANVYEHLQGLWSWYETEDLLNGMPVRQSGVSLHKGDAFPVLSGPGRGLIRLNPTAVRIWEMCDGKNSPANIARTISENCDVSPGVCFKDVIIALRTFKRQGLIVMT